MSGNLMKHTEVENVLQLLNEMDINKLCYEQKALNEMKEGKQYYFLEAASGSNAIDITRDCFSPWSGKGRTGKRETTNVTYRQVECTSDGYKLCKNLTEEKLKIIRNTHASIDGFRREIFFVERNKILVSPVLYVYSSSNDFVTPVPDAHQILPSQSKMVKEALNFRTSRTAKMMLETEGVEISMSQISSLSRSVPNHIKTNIGRRAPTDFYKIMDRYLAKTNPEEVISSPVIESKDDGKLTVRVMVGFPKSFDCFSVGLPTTSDVDHHRKEVRHILEMSEREGDDYFNSFLQMTNKSGSLPCLGSSIMIDTTFSLCSAELVTIALGVSDQFKSSDSDKNTSILLAYMIHTSKESSEHEAFAVFLNSLLNKHCSGKTVNLIVHDGEASFRAYNSGIFLKDSVMCRCDVHRLQNIKEKCATTEEYEWIQKQLYGEKKSIPGGIVLNKGILNTFAKSTYDIKIRALIGECKSEALRTWLLKNSAELYEHNSMFKKLLGGWPIQFFFTNIVEARNAFIKTLITCKKPAQKVLDDFLQLHREEIAERLKAVVGKPSKYKTDFAETELSWRTKTRFEKLTIIASFGLEDLSEFDEMEHVPNWCLPAKIPKRELFLSMQKWEVHRSESDVSTFFVFNSENRADCVMVNVLANDNLKCFGYSCKNKKDFRLCLHTLKVFQTLNEDVRGAIVAAMDAKRSSRTSIDLLREQMKPEHGSKYKRVGRTFSHGNHSRAFTAIANSIDDDSDTTIQDNNPKRRRFNAERVDSSDDDY